jgi:hypothetical protein
MMGTVEDDELLQVAGGPVYRLHPPLTIEALKYRVPEEDARVPWRCRLRHAYREVGVLWMPDPVRFPVQATTQLMAGKVYARLVQCDRCGDVAAEMRP